MNKQFISVFGVISLMLLVVFVSGCTTTQNNTKEKMIYEYSFNHTSWDEFDNVNVTLPDGTTYIKIEYINLTKGGNSPFNETYSRLEVDLLNTVLPEGQLNNLGGAVVDLKTVQIKNNTLSGNLNFTRPNIKSILIRGINIRGTVKVYVS